MLLCPSGNHILWIRPRFQDAKEHPLGKWGDEGGKPDAKHWFSIAWDPDNEYWIARTNFEICREFMGAVSGAAKKDTADLYFYASAEANTEAALVLLNYKYVTEMVARTEGNAFRGAYQGKRGGTFFKLRTRYIRQLDASAMTPDERLGEMVNLALTDDKFKGKISKEFGALASPPVLFGILAVIGIFIGVGAGAAFLGGAAFAAALSRFLGLAFTAAQVNDYVKLFKEIERHVYSENNQGLYLGASAVQSLLVQILKDIAMVQAMKGAISLGSKGMAVLKNLFLKYTPAKWKEAGQEALSAIKNKAAQAAAGKHGYLGEQFMKRFTNVTKYFAKGEDAVFRERSAKQNEMIVVRGPSSERLQWLTKLRGWIDGKPEWIKAKSWMGWHGIVGIPKTAEISAIVEQGARSNYPMGNLKGVFKEVDEYIAKNATRPAYEVPYGKNFTDPVKNKKVFDWDAAGANYSLAKGAKLVDIGDRYIVVDALGRPICQDLDIGSIVKLGTPTPGAHLKSGKGNPEDNFLAEDIWNYRFFQKTWYMYNPIKHGGAGGSARHAVENRAAEKPHWSCRENGGFIDEELLVYLPYRDSAGRMTSDLFHFKGWGELEQFCKANDIPFGF
ncbi:MAG: hypothetical protein NW208_03960 [Bryobacter sp.]|nr:hypothetical protein [Bryobacter sp.]